MKFLNKRIISLLLAMVMLCGMMPMTVLATEGTQETEAVEVVTEPAVAPEVIHEHDYDAVVTEPTCTEQGYTTYTCECGDSYVADYVDATGKHTYENGICTDCGEEHTNLANYKGKVISILGDSISTFAGYIPVADGFNLAHRPRYPQSNLFSDVNLTWWMQTITALDAKLGINDSWAGSTVTNTITGNSGDLGEKAAMASLTRIRNLGANGTPDVILFYGGTNDIGRLLPLGSFDPATAPTEVDLTTTKWTTVADAYVDAIMRLQYYYPEAEILAMLPTYTTSFYTNAKLAQYNSVFSAICEHYGIPYIDLRDCGISTTDLPDGIHPDENGMDYITGAVLDMLLNDVEMEVGENVVHSVTHNLNGAESSMGYYKGVTHGKSFVTTITGENVAVCVTMGGVDITDTAYANGVVTVAAVTDDLVITVQGRVKSVYEDHLQKLPESLCCSTNLWSSLVPENTYYTGSAWGNVSGNSVYSITIPVAVGDQIWATSFQKSGTNGGSRNGIRLTWFDENGVLESVSPDNVYAEFVANAFVTAPDGAVTVNVVMWNGKESNEVYLLNRNHTYENGICTGCGEKLSFESMSLRYDDHLDMSGKTVEIIDAGMPTSYQVGYGVEENAVLDTAVVTLKGDTLVATGIGTATVKVDGETYEITVTAAPISLLLLIGQSNMRGSEGNANQSIVCPDGMVYATFGDDRGDAEGIMNVNNATNFAASALTGEYSTINVNGSTENLSYYPINSLTEAGKGTFGPDSGFAYEWVKQTGEKVWVVNAAHGGSSITSWQPNATNFKKAVLLFSACQETLRKEIAAGHFTLSHMGYFWCQGCNDYNWTAEKYVTNYLAMHDGLKSTLSFDHDSNSVTDSVIFEFAGIIPVRAGHDYNDGYREDEYTDTASYKFYESFMDLQMTGPRVAQYWMCNNPELEDIWMVCNIGEDWVWMPDGTNGVSDYFQSHYVNGTVDYTTQVAQKASWYTPTTPAAVHDSIHYNQIGYNEIGRESVRNALIMLGEISAPNVTPEVKFLTWDGFTSADTVIASPVGVSGTLVVPKVYPVWKSKDVTYTVSKGLRYEYYDLLAETVRTEGTLTASNDAGTITVAPRELTSFRWELDGNEFANLIDDNWDENTIIKLAGSVTDGVFNGVRYRSDKPVQLLHDETWCVEIQITNWTAKSGTMILSSNPSAAKSAPYFYFRPADFFVGIGCYNGSTYDYYGVSLKNHGIACSMGVHTYQFVNRISDDGSNMVYLIVDNQEIGALTDHYINSTLADSGNAWLSGQNFSMLYFGTTTAPISNCTINYIAITENNYNPDMHLHDWSDWDIGWTIDGKLIISRVCAHDLSHIEEKTGDTYEDAVTLLKDVISEELRYVFIASYSENGKMLGVRMIDISNKHESFELPKDAEQIRIMYLDAFFKPFREVSTSVKSKLAVSAE